MSFTLVEQCPARLNRSELAVPGSNPRFLEKAPPVACFCLWGKSDRIYRLDRHCAVDEGIVTAVHRTHGSMSEFPEDPVTSYLLHGCSRYARPPIMG